MASLSFGNAVMAGIQASADKAMAAQQQAWIDALVGAKLADEATLRSLLSLDAVVPRKRGRPAAGAAAKVKVCDVASSDRCLGCKWGGGDLDKAQCSAAASGDRTDQLCSGCGTSWDVVWADRKADGRVSYGTKGANPSDVAWFGFWGVDRLPIWPGEQHCVMAKAGAKSNSGNGVAMAKSLDAAAGGSRKRGIWHQAREAWVAAAVEAPTELQADTTVVAEADATVVPEADARTGVERSFDGLAYTTYTDETSSPVTTHVWPIGEWLASAGYESKVVVTLTDLDTAVGFVDEDGDIIFTDYEIGEVHEAASKPTSSD